MITIIGAGPAGCYLGYLLAKQGKKVEIFEEKKNIGSPVQCTGIVTKDIEKFLKLDKSVVINQTKKTRINSKTDFFVFNNEELILGRKKFDLFMAKKATHAGVKIHISAKFVGIEKKKNKVSKIIISSGNNRTTKKYDVDLLIGADGPNSAVAKSAGLFQKRNFYLGTQAVIKTNIDADTYSVFLDTRFKKFFAWVVPENNKTARVGFGAPLQDSKNDFSKLKKFLDMEFCGNYKILEKQAGLIPIYNPKQIIKKNNVWLIGDAATQVKATTGGGIIPAFSFGKEIAKIICSSEGKKTKKNYRNIDFKTGKQLMMHSLIRTNLNKFSDKDYNQLIKYCNQEKIKKVLNQKSREKSIQLIMSLLIKEPRFAIFAKNLLK